MSVRRDLVADLLAGAILCGGHRRPDEAEIEEALAVAIPRGAQAGVVLGELIESGGAEELAAWISWSLKQPQGYWLAEFERALELVAFERFPEVWADVLGNRREAA